MRGWREGGGSEKEVGIKEGGGGRGGDGGKEREELRE